MRIITVIPTPASLMSESTSNAKNINVGPSPATSEQLKAIDAMRLMFRILRCEEKISPGTFDELGSRLDQIAYMLPTVEEMRERMEKGATNKILEWVDAGRSTYFIDQNDERFEIKIVVTKQ